MPAETSDEKPEGSVASVKTGRTRTAWNQHAKRLLQAEMTKRGVSYKQLSRLLQDGGRADSDASLMTRINRGTFSLAFFLEALRVMGAESIDISHIKIDVESRARSRK
jgi:hypothetical protein